METITPCEPVNVVVKITSYHEEKGIYRGVSSDDSDWLSPTKPRENPLEKWLYILLCCL